MDDERWRELRGWSRRYVTSLYCELVLRLKGTIKLDLLDELFELIQSDIMYSRCHLPVSTILLIKRKSSGLTDVIESYPPAYSSPGLLPAFASICLFCISKISCGSLYSTSILSGISISISRS